MRYRSKHESKKKPKIKNEYVPNEEFLETIEEQLVCSCWPEHCNDTAHAKEFGDCWCSPVITYYKWGYEIQHSKEV